MKRLKIILAVVAAVATMMVLAAPAMANHNDVTGGTLSLSGGAGGGLSAGSVSSGGSGGTIEIDGGTSSTGPSISIG